MENFTEIQLAWAAYIVGALGCSLATWMLFRRAGRAWTHFFVITVMVLLLTPYAIEVGDMLLAPAIYSLVFGFMDGGFIAIKPIVKLLLGIWAGALVLSLIYQLLTRPREDSPQQQQSLPLQNDYHDPTDVLLAPRSSRAITEEERRAHDDLLNEEPIRAIR